MSTPLAITSLTWLNAHTLVPVVTQEPLPIVTIDLESTLKIAAYELERCVAVIELTLDRDVVRES